MIHKHGEYIKGGDWKGSRWCSICNVYHGFLYSCPYYPKHIAGEITKQRDEATRLHNDENWINQQIENGIPREVLEIMKILIA